ncbi:MAG: adeC [Dehalococcoidia bacterium]|nr:adeC [Dehalococcoidia bacterium]
MAPSARELRQLAEVALGREKADIVIANGNVVSVHTGEVLEGLSVAIKGERVAFVGAKAEHTIGPDTEVLDVSGRTLLPGFIDGHSHLLWYCRPDNFLKHSMKGGTTTIVSESGEAFFPLGYDGAVDFYDAVGGQPVKIFFTIPSMLTLSPIARSHGMTIDMAEKLYRRRDVLGLGECISWPAVLAGDSRVLDLFALTISRGKKIEGHTAGARGNKLVALAATGISSCHEPTTADEVLDRLRLGVYVLVREGGVRRDLEAISSIRESGIDFRRLLLATDGLSPGEVLKYGHMEFLVQKAIDLGFEPVTAVQMATLNVAEHFGLDGDIGSITPGKYADIVVVPDVRTIRAEYVFSSGQLVAQNGVLVRLPREPVFSDAVRKSVHLDNDFGIRDFDICVGAGAAVKVRVIDMHTGLVTREKHVELVSREGLIGCDPGKDILKVAAIERTHRSGKRFTGLVSGFGLKSGAIASSDAWDCTDIVVVGADDSDMALAVNRIVALQGGMVVCAGGKVVAEWPMPIAGMLSDEPVEAASRGLASVQQKAMELGCRLADAHLSLSMLTTPAVPYLRICESGLVDIASRQIVDLVVR